MNLEHWRPIPNRARYAISNQGRVYSWKALKYIKAEPLRAWEGS